MEIRISLSLSAVAGEGMGEKEHRSDLNGDCAESLYHFGEYCHFINVKYLKP